MEKNSFSKAERLNSKILIDSMFAGGSKSFSVFPIRLVFIPVEEKAKAPAGILISVPKKRFKRAVHRNRVKRQIREIYRQNKHELVCVLEEKKISIAIAFIYLSDELLPTALLETKMQILLARTIEKLP